MPTPTTPRPRLGGSIAWSVLLVLVLPAAIGALWGIGRGWDAILDLADRANLTWPHVWVGLAVVAGFAVIVATTHATRSVRARTRDLEAAAAALEDRVR